MEQLAPLTGTDPVPEAKRPGTQHIAPAAWSPLIYNFRHYHALAPEIGHGFRSETARSTV